MRPDWDIMRLQFTGRVRVIMSAFMRLIGRAAVALTLCVAFQGLTGSAAQARVFVSIGVPFYGPAFYPPPVYYAPPPIYYPPPPVTYAPPPITYAPPQAYSPQAGGQACYAGAYSCPMDHPVAPGGSCYCLGNGGQRVWGRAN
jgi:hypothetical protein